MKGQEKRKALGRGLEALIPSGPAATLSTGITEIDIDRITPNRQQPRETFDSEALAELADSIRENGIIQPLVLRPSGRDFELVAGERRWRAAQQAGLQRVPAVIRHVSDDKLLEVALVENLQRRDLTPLETSRALQALIDEHGLSQEELARRVGMKRPTLTNYLRLRSLSAEVVDALEEGRIDMGHAKALLSVESAERQVELCRQVVRSGLSVRQAEALARKEKDRGAPAADAAQERPDPNVVAAEKRLQGALGCRTRIVRGPQGGGRIELLFRSDEELDHLFEVLVGNQEVATGAV